MQVMIAASIREAEYVVLSDVVQEGFILPELKSYAITIREDSKGAIKLANNKYSSCRTRHIDVKHHIVLDTIGRGKARVLSVETQKQHAKILNKPLN
ncbi:unnamed protein product, partial [Sphacelaria rigidula]